MLTGEVEQAPLLFFTGSPFPLISVEIRQTENKNGWHLIEHMKANSVYLYSQLFTPPSSALILAAQIVVLTIQ